MTGAAPYRTSRTAFPEWAAVAQPGHRRSVSYMWSDDGATFHVRAHVSEYRKAVAVIKAEMAHDALYRVSNGLESRA